MVTVMLIASPPVVSQTLEDEERKKEKDRETDRRKVTVFYTNLNRKTNWIWLIRNLKCCYCSEKHDHIDSKQHVGNSDWHLHYQVVFTHHHIQV